MLKMSSSNVIKERVVGADPLRGMEHSFISKTYLKI
jgi:hypothetical protein